ncbi:MAG TPA: PhnD/SsuA/transferrin family substrate-binding protein, partial [Gallionella sp.]|nr:PhnD/SsuA/transferrin family substrate-binding protein [Gallionella sp.]
MNLPGSSRPESIRGLAVILALLAVLMSAALPVSPAHAAEPVKIGVLAFRPKPQTLAQWQPLAQILKKAIPERDFVIEALTNQEMDMAVASRQLDFVLTNPSHYVLLSHHSGLSSPLATLAEDARGQAVSVFGGVIFSRADSAGINSLADLKGKSIAALGTESMGGYQMQAYELKRQGIRPSQEIRLLSVGAPQDNVVNEVLAGHAEAGFVRTGVLEALSREGKLDMAQLKIIAPQNLPGFPAQVSTRLYPEWPFAALPHIDDNLARRVAAALLVLEQNSAASKSLGIHGFVIPADYTPVEDMMRELRMPPFDLAPEFTLNDVWNQYRWQVIAALAACGLIAFLLARLLWTNRRLDAEHRTVLEQKQQLQESEYRWKFALEGSGDGLWDWNLTDNTVFYSRRWKEMLGYREDEIGDSLGEWDKRVHPDDKTATLQTLQAHLDGKSPMYVSEHRVHSKDGDWKWILDRGVVVSRDKDGKPLRMIGTHTDVTDRHQMEEQVRQLALYDSLTKLPNRRLLNERLSHVMAASKRSGCYCALMFLDLDNFKPLNDTHGHAVGDLLLVEVAIRLKNCVRAMDTVARFGGDEFVVMLGELVADRNESTAQARIVAEKIRLALAEPYSLTVAHENQADTRVDHHCTTSIGAVVFIDHEATQDDILKWADAAMYRAKKAGRNS